MKKIQNLIIAVALITFTIASTQTIAQGNMGQPVQTATKDYSDEDLKNFVAVGQEINLIQQQGQQELMTAIEAEKMDITTFNKIASLEQSGETAAEAGITDQQLKSFEKLMPLVQSTQQEMQVKMQKVITDSDLEISEYEEMMMAYQHDRKFQQRINDMLEP